MDVEHNKRKGKKSMTQQHKPAQSGTGITTRQQAVVQALYQFRFVTAKEMSDATNVQPETARQLLERLRRTGLVARRFEPSYKLAGRSAEYYLTPAAIPLLRRNIAYVSESELKQLYRRAEASERFAQRSIIVFRLANALERLYGERLDFVPKALLTAPDLDYLPPSLPEGLITIEDEDKQRPDQHIFVEYFDEAIAIGIQARQIVTYMQYQETGEWERTGFAFPSVWLICESEKVAQQIEKRLQYYGQEYGSGIEFRIRLLEDVLQEKPKPT